MVVCRRFHQTCSRFACKAEEKFFVETLIDDAAVLNKVLPKFLKVRNWQCCTFRWPMVAPVVTSYTIGILRLFDPFWQTFRAAFCVVRALSHANLEFRTFHNVDGAKRDHLRTQPLSQCKWFVKVSWCESPGSTLPLRIVPFRSPGGGMSRRYRTRRWHGSCRTYPKNANSHVICKVKKQKNA